MSVGGRDSVQVTAIAWGLAQQLSEWAWTRVCEANSYSGVCGEKKVILKEAAVQCSNDAIKDCLFDIK